MHIAFAFFEGLLTFRNLAFTLIDSKLKDGRASVKNSRSPSLISGSSLLLPDI